MSHGHGDHHHAGHIHVLPPDKAKIALIWKTALILGIITAIEFILAFTVERGTLLVTVFVTLTLVKAFYIVGEFMHLKYEVKMLIWSIVLPMLFVLWLIVALMVEGDTIFHLREAIGEYFTK